MSKPAPAPAAPAAAEVKPAPAPAAPVEEAEVEYVLTERFYRLGRMYSPGERVRAKPSMKGMTWRLAADVDAEMKAAAVVPSIAAAPKTPGNTEI